MQWTEWLAPVATLFGAALAYFGARAGARQRDRADARAEWGRRFELALREIAAGTDAIRVVRGREILRHLAASDHVTEADRLLAWKIIGHEQEMDLRGQPPGSDVDRTSVGGDTEGNAVMGGDKP